MLGCVENGKNVLQEPVDSVDEGYLFGGEPDGGEDEDHGDEAGGGDAGGADTGRDASDADGEHVAQVHVYVVQLGDEDGRQGLVQGCPVHVHRGPYRDHEAGHPRVQLVLLLQTVERQRQRRRAEITQVFIPHLYYTNSDFIFIE